MNHVRAMSEENGQHEFNFFLDKQIQQKLLEADDEVLAREAQSTQNFSKQKASGNTAIGSNSVSNVVNKNNNFNSSKLLKEFQTFPLCGWWVKPNVVFRRTEDISSKSKGNAVASNRESLLSRDARSRPQLPQEFVFRHYTDPRRYIEQYRREHVCYDTANSSATRSEFLDSRRFYAYNQYSPLAVCTQNSVFQQSSTLPPPYQEPSFVQNSDQPYLQKQQSAPTIQYTNRRDQQRQTIHATLRSNSQHKNKPSNTPSNKTDTTQISEQKSDLSDSSQSRDCSRRMGSAKESASAPAVNGLSVKKNLANKMNMVAPNSARKLKSNPQGSPLDPNISNQFVGHKLGNQSGSASQPRTLDTLACVGGNAGEKQPPVSSKSKGIANGRHTKRKTPANNNSDHNTPGDAPVSSRKSGATETSKVTFSDNSKCLSENRTNLPDLCGEGSVGSHAKTNFKEWIEHSRLLNGRVGDSDDSDGAVSIGRLSTTCLGVEATVKQRPKLEPSCTYHVFPNEFMLNANSGFGPTLVWNPAKSSLDKRPLTSHQLDSGLAAPFRTSPLSRPSTEEGGYRTVEFITKEFVPESRPLTLCPDIHRDNTQVRNTSPGLKANTIKPDLPPTFQLKGISKRPQFETLKKKRGLSKTAGSRRKKEGKDAGGRKSWSASTDTSSCTSPALRLKPTTTAELLKSQGLDAGGRNSRTGNTPNGGTAAMSLGPVPYFKFWNSSLAPKSREGRGGRREKHSELNLQQLAQLVLADENGRRDHELAEAAKKVLEQQKQMETEDPTRAGIATGNSGLPQTVNTSPQAQLESLRSVNKRLPSPQPPQLHLTYISEEDDWPEMSPPPEGVGTLHPSPFSHPGNTLVHGNSCENTTADINRSSHQDVASKTKHPISNEGDLFRTPGFDCETDQSPIECEECVFSEDGGQWHSNSEAVNSKDRTRTGVSPQRKTGKKTRNTHGNLSTSSSWKERLLLKQDHHSRSSVTNHWIIAKRQEERSLISHKRRIRHLIEQSRLKSRFGQILGQTKGAADKVMLEISSLNISKPFSKPGPGTDLNHNNSSQPDQGHEVFYDVFFPYSNTKSFCDHEDSASNCKSCMSPGRLSTPAAQVTGKKNGLLGEDLLYHLHGNTESKLGLPVSPGEGQIMDKEETDKALNLSMKNRKLEHVLDAATRKYIDELAGQVSATVEFRSPKLRYRKRSSFSRSQTMNL